MGEGIQAHYVGGAVGGGFGATEAAAGEVVHHIEAQAEFFGVVDGGEHGEHADAVADKVGRVFSAYHAFA